MAHALTLTVDAHACHGKQGRAGGKPVTKCLAAKALRDRHLPSFLSAFLLGVSAGFYRVRLLFPPSRDSELSCGLPIPFPAVAAQPAALILGVITDVSRALLAAARDISVGFGSGQHCAAPVLDNLAGVGVGSAVTWYVQKSILVRGSIYRLGVT